MWLALRKVQCHCSVLLVSELFLPVYRTGAFLDTPMNVHVHVVSTEADNHKGRLQSI